MIKQLLLSFLLSTLFVLQLSAQVLNDDCFTATVISNPKDYCSGDTEFSNVGATQSFQTEPLCWTDAQNDVWFTFVPSEPAALISIFGQTLANDGKINDPAMAIYSGSCNNLTLENCQELSDNGPNLFELYIDNLTLGQQYFIRINGRAGNTGSFQLCVKTFIPVPTPESDCIDAVVLCDKSPFQVESLTGSGMFPQELANVPNVCYNPSPGQPQFLPESSSSWYKWTCKDPGSLTFTLTPNNNPPGAISDDLDFLLFRLPNGLDDCDNKELIRCMLSGANGGQTLDQWAACNGPTGLMLGDGDTEEFNGCQQGNNNFVESIDMIAGESYALIIMNFTESSQGFSIEFGGTGTFVGPEPDFEATLPTAEESFECDKTITFEDLSSSATDVIVEWVWNFGVGADVSFATGPGPHEVIYESFGDKIVALTVTSARGCEVTKILDLFVEPCCADTSTLSLLVDAFDIECNGEETGQLSLSGISGTPQYNYSVNGGPFLPNPIINGLPAGDFTIQVQDIKGCIAEATSFIDEPPVLVVEVGEDQQIDLGLSTFTTSSAGGGTGMLTYEWIPCEGLSCCDCPDPDIFPSEELNTYTLIVTDENGCEARDEINILTLFDPSFHAPNIFSPNNDGVNDFFNVFAGIDARPEYELMVYDRWGNLLYNNTAVPLNDRDMGWDGRVNGVAVDPGVFTWLAKLTYINNESIYYSGDVTIVK